MNRMTINKPVEGNGGAVWQSDHSSTFGIAGSVMLRLNEVAVGREGSTLT